MRMSRAIDRAPLGERLASSVVITDSGCWEWMFNRNQAGYGRISVKGRKMLVHRVVYEIATGTLPPELDHLCRNPPCCNPAHLEPVTHAENMARRRQWVCARGHPRAPLTRCLVCQRATGRLSYRRRTLGGGHLRVGGEVITADIEPGIYPAPDDPNDGLLICRLSSLHEVVAAISENWETA